MSINTTKRIGAIVFSGALVLAVACKKEETNVSTGTDSSSSTSSAVTNSSSGTMSTDSTMTSTSSSTDTMTTATTGSAGSSLSSLPDGHFAEESANGGMAEVQLGNLASQKAQSADVKKFAEHMVKDHTKANDEFSALLTKKGATAPTDIDAEHKAVVDQLTSLSGADFDKAYMKAMVDDHNKTVDLFQTESKSGSDADMKSWAGKTLPTLKEHQKMAKSLAAKVGAK